MIISCATCSLRGMGRDEVEQTFRYAPSAGYTAWGLGGEFTWLPGHIRWMDAARVRAAAEAAGLPVCTEVWTPPIPTSSRSAALLGAEDVALCAEVALSLGCPVIVQTGGHRCEGGLEHTIAGLERLLQRIAALPVQVALEPHVSSQILRHEDYAAIFGALDAPQLGITVDTGHFHSAGVDWKALIAAFPDRIFNVHVKDHIGVQSVAIGSGEIDLHGMIASLRAVGYTGALAVEMEVTDPENLPRYIGEAHQYIQGLL